MEDEQGDDTAPETRVGDAAPGHRARAVPAARNLAGAVVVAVVLGLAVLAWVGAPAAYPPYTSSPGAVPLSAEVAATDRAASTQAIVTTRASVLTALAGGADEVEIVRHGRWASATTMRGYLEEGTRFRATHPVHRLTFPSASEEDVI